MFVSRINNCEKNVDLFFDKGTSLNRVVRSMIMNNFFCCDPLERKNHKKFISETSHDLTDFLKRCMSKKKKKKGRFGR